MNDRHEAEQQRREQAARMEEQARERRRQDERAAEQARERRQHFDRMCTNCQASNSRVIGTLCSGCATQLRAPETVEPPADLFYAQAAAYEPYGRRDDADEPDFMEQQRSERERLANMCLVCLSEHSRAIGTMCYACWKQVNPETPFPQPSPDGTNRQWAVYMSERSLQDHHLASNKNGEWTAEYEAIATAYGLHLDDDAWNVVTIRHGGSHPEEYHGFVLGTMQWCQQEAGDDRERFLALFKELVSDTVREAPQMARAGFYRPKGVRAPKGVRREAVIPRVKERTAHASLWAGAGLSG